MVAILPSRIARTVMFSRSKSKKNQVLRFNNANTPCQDHNQQVGNDQMPGKGPDQVGFMLKGPVV